MQPMDLGALGDCRGPTQSSCAGRFRFLAHDRQGLLSPDHPGVLVGLTDDRFVGLRPVDLGGASAPLMPPSGFPIFVVVAGVLYLGLQAKFRRGRQQSGDVQSLD